VGWQKSQTDEADGRRRAPPQAATSLKVPTVKRRDAQAKTGDMSMKI
jgi:hypothetical protein